MKTNIVFLLSLNLFLLQSLVTYSQDNNRSINNVKAFSKVYGYVRYFYPGDEASVIDWDNFAIHGVNSVVNIKSTDSLKEKLNELFFPIAPLIKFDQEIDTTQAYYKPKGRKFKKVTWQYLGYENEYSNAYYQCRKNRPHRKHLVNQKSGIMTLNANQFHIDTIKISAKMKLKEGSKGYGYLFLQQQSLSSILYQNNMPDNPVIVQDSFILREISSVVFNATEKIKFGFMLKGTGTLEISDFNVAYFHNNTWIPIDISNKQFIINKTDTVTYSNSIPISMQLTDTVIFEKSRTPYKQTPKYSDFIYDEISDSLFVYMPLALFGDAKHTYPISDTVNLNKLNNTITKLKPFNVENLNDRLANVVIIWNIFQHFYPYIKEFDVNWNKTLEYGLQKCYTDSTKESYLMLLRSLLSGFDDAHIYIKGPTDNVYSPPFQCIWVENKLVVSKVFSDNCPLKVGDILTKINNKGADTILDSLMNYVSAYSQYFKYHRDIQYLLFGEKESAITVQVLRNENEFYSYILKRNTYYFDYSVQEQDEAKPYYNSINDSIFYVDFTRIPRDTLSNLLPTLLKYKNIIVDFRGYPKLRPDDWIPHIINEKTSVSNLFFTDEIIYPNHSKNKLASFPDRLFIPKEPIINARFFYLTNSKAMSAAETFLYYLKYVILLYDNTKHT